MAKYKAVIFDLFGTLVCIAPWHKSENALRQMASVLSAPPDILIRLWRDTLDKRMKGVFQNYEACIRFICKELRLFPENSQINLAAQIRFEMERCELMMLKEDAVEVLGHLRSHGYKIGLISNASFETAAIWTDTPLSQLIDVTIFSGPLGIMKPDPRIYHTAIEQLAVEPKDCLYIADGTGGELEGALQVGMYPAQLRIPDENYYDSHRDEWDGLSISSLKQVLTLVK